MIVKVSIVTICYNEVANIEATMRSVVAQTYGNIEYIVKDGGSTDETVDIVRKFELGIRNEGRVDFSFRWVSEKDGGLYKGMNAGLAMCTGDYVLFCNAGDRLAANDVIEKMVAKAESDGSPDLVYGDCMQEINGAMMVRTAHGPKFMRMGMPASHEAMLYKLSLVRRLGLQYDPSHRIAADYKFTYQFVNAAKSFSYVPIPVVVFNDGGVSSENRLAGLIDASRVRKEVSGLSFISRLTIVLMQCAAITISTCAGPLYRAVRLRRAK